MRERRVVKISIYGVQDVNSSPATFINTQALCLDLYTGTVYRNRRVQRGFLKERGGGVKAALFLHSSKQRFMSESVYGNRRVQRVFLKERILNDT